MAFLRKLRSKPATVARNVVTAPLLLEDMGRDVVLHAKRPELCGWLDGDDDSTVAVDKADEMKELLADVAANAPTLPLTAATSVAEAVQEVRA
jgi:hypothetical protein